MKTLLIAAAVLVAGAFSANAQPVPGRSALAPAVQDSLLQQVDWACGPGWRLNRWGDCVPRRGPPPPRYYHRDRDWGWGPPPPPRYRPPSPPSWGWGPPPRRHWGPPDRW